jgi:hypothetical protein
VLRSQWCGDLKFEISDALDVVGIEYTCHSFQEKWRDGSWVRVKPQAVGKKRPSMFENARHESKHITNPIIGKHTSLAMLTEEARKHAAYILTNPAVG